MNIKITCKDASRLISTGLDRQLSMGDRTALRLHLAVCDTCNKLKAQFEFLRRAMSTFRSERDDQHK